MSTPFKKVVFFLFFAFVEFFVWMELDLLNREQLRVHDELTCWNNYYQVQGVMRYGWSHPCRQYYDEWYFWETQGLGWEWPYAGWSCTLFNGAGIPSRPLLCQDLTTGGLVTWGEPDEM